MPEGRVPGHMPMWPPSLLNTAHAQKNEALLSFTVVNP
jgi:hypothetical protein